MLTLKRVLEKQKQHCILKSAHYFICWTFLIHRAYEPKFLQQEKSIEIYITHDYQASDDHSMIILCFDLLVRHDVGPFLDKLKCYPKRFLKLTLKRVKTETRQYS